MAYAGLPSITLNSFWLKVLLTVAHSSVYIVRNTRLSVFQHQLSSMKSTWLILMLANSLTPQEMIYDRTSIAWAFRDRAATKGFPASLYADMAPEPRLFVNFAFGKFANTFLRSWTRCLRTYSRRTWKLSNKRRDEHSSDWRTCSRTSRTCSRGSWICSRTYKVCNAMIRHIAHSKAQFVCYYVYTDTI